MLEVQVRFREDRKLQKRACRLYEVTWQEKYEMLTTNHRRPNDTSVTPIVLCDGRCSYTRKRHRIVDGELFPRTFGAGAHLLVPYVLSCSRSVCGLNALSAALAALWPATLTFFDALPPSEPFRNDEVRSGNVNKVVFWISTAATTDGPLT